MQGIIQKLQGEFTDDTMARYYPEDPRLNKGSLALYEPAHIMAPVVGLSNNLILPNIARTPASFLTGADEANLSAVMVLPADASTEGRGLYERSAKGGIHGIVSQNKDKFTVAGSHGSSLRFDQAGRRAILDYIRANPTHSYFTTTWIHLTRLGNNYDESQSTKIWPSLGGVISSTGSSSNDYLYLQSVTRNNSRPSEVPPARISRRSPAPSSASFPSDAVGALRLSSGASGITGIVNNITMATCATWGHIQNGTNAYASGKPAYPSYIFYSTYLEDCTVSGRSLEECDAADAILFEKEVLTPGGKYYGDTFTSPATIA